MTPVELQRHLMGFVFWVKVMHALWEGLARDADAVEFPGWHGEIKFRFDHIDAVDLRYFNHQNVISDLSITQIEAPSDHAILRIDFGSCFGLEGGFRAISGSVVEVIPCDEDATPRRSSGE